MTLESQLATFIRTQRADELSDDAARIARRVRLAAVGTSLLVSSHVMDEATRCDRLLLMRDGEILADETPAGLLAATGAHDAENAFLALIRRHPKHLEEGVEQ